MWLFKKKALERVMELGHKLIDIHVQRTYGMCAYIPTMQNYKVWDLLK